MEKMKFPLRSETAEVALKLSTERLSACVNLKEMFLEQSAILFPFSVIALKPTDTLSPALKLT